MTDQANQSALDDEESRKTYIGVMKAVGEIGLPFSLGLAVLFTNLVLSNGILTALLGAIITYLIVFFIVKTFFSH